MSSEPCPGPELLEDLISNRLSAQEAERVRRHLQTCPRCRKSPASDPEPTKPALVPVPSDDPRLKMLAPPRGPGELGWLDHYRVLAVLGVGGMAIVFDAEDTVLHRPVALKVMRPEIDDMTMRMRFLQEARALAALSDEHVSSVYQVGEANGAAYMAMEKLRGEPVEVRLQRDRTLPLAEALSLTRQAAEGLAAAHERGVIHRDIKPSNLWLETARNGGYRLKLIDFGIARTLGDADGLSTPGQIVGTPQYMAPEQAAGQPVDGRADLYSLGCVLFRMLVGTAPFEGRSRETTMAFLQAIIKGDAPKVSLAAPHLPSSVADLIQRLLARDPAQRPSSATELVAQLRRLEATDGGMTPLNLATAPPPSPVTARRGRQPALIGVMIGVGAIMLALLVGAMVGYRHLTRQTDAPAVDSHKEPIVVGLLFSTSATMARHERPILQATRLAIKEINDKGGVLGRQIKAMEEDGASDDKEFESRAKHLCGHDDAAVIFGCWTSSSRKLVADVCTNYDRLLFYSAGYEGLEQHSHVVYLSSTPNQTLFPLLEWAEEEGHKKFYLVGSEYVYSHAVNAMIEDWAKEHGATIVAKPRYALLGETDFGETVKDIQAKAPDMIICSIDGDSLKSFQKALREAKITPAKTPTAWLNVSEAEFSWMGAKTLVGDFSTACYFESLDLPANKEFIARYRERYGKDARTNDAMECAYAGVYLWKQAVEKAKTVETRLVRNALLGMKMDTPAGPLRMSSSRLFARRQGFVGEIVLQQGLGQFQVVRQTNGAIEAEPWPPGRTVKQWEEFLYGLQRGWEGRWEKHR